MKKQFEDYITYDIEINDDDETGISLISVVGNPATEVEGVFMSEQEELECEFKFYSDEMIIAGPTMIANKLIKRNDPIRGKHYERFRPDVIKKMVEKFMKGNNNTMINFEHSDKMVKAFVRDAFIIEDPIFNNARKYGFNKLPVGSHFIVLKVEDKQFWNNEVKKNGKTSFSIEGLMNVMPMKYSVQSESVEMASIPAHENCQCKMVNGEWITEPTACDYCKDMADKYNNKSFSVDDLSDSEIINMYAEMMEFKIPDPNSGEKQDEFISRCMGNQTMVDEYEKSQRYAICQLSWETKMSKMAKDKISFDYDGVLTTSGGRKLLEDNIENDVYIISARSNIDPLLKLADEYNIPHSNVFATGSNKEKINKIKELGVLKHYDNNNNVVEELGNIGNLYK